MRILVKKQDLLDQITVALKDYDEKYNKAVDLYLEKLQKYIEYVRGYATSTEKNELKYPPSMPSWMRNNFVRTETALKAHMGDKISLEDDEYNNILHGIENMRDTITANIATLMSYSA